MSVFEDNSYIYLQNIIWMVIVGKITLWMTKKIYYPTESTMII